MKGITINRVLKKVIIAAIFIVCLTTLIKIHIKLDKYTGLIVYQTAKPLSPWHKEEIMEYLLHNRHIEDIFIYEGDEEITAPFGNDGASDNSGEKNGGEASLYTEGTTIIFKAAEGTSSIIDRTIEKDMKVFSDMYGGDYKIDNVDFEARYSIMFIKALYILLLISASYISGIFIYKKLKKLLESLKPDFENYYLKEAFKQNAPKLLSIFILPLLYAASILLLFKIIGFELVLPPEIIPPRFIDTDIIITGLKNWYIEIDSRSSALTTMGFYARYSRILIFCCGFVLSIIAIYFLAKKDVLTK